MSSGSIARTSTGEPSSKRRKNDDSLDNDQVEADKDGIRVDTDEVNEQNAEQVEANNDDRIQVDTDKVNEQNDEQVEADEDGIQVDSGKVLKDYASRMAFVEKEFKDDASKVAAMKSLIHSLITNFHRAEEQLKNVHVKNGDLENQVGTLQLEVKRYRYILGIRRRIEQLATELYPRWLPAPPNNNDKWKIIIRHVSHFRVSQLRKRLRDAKIEVEACPELISSFYGLHPRNVHSVNADELTDGDKDSIFRDLGIVDKDTQQLLMILTDGFGVAPELHVPPARDEENVFDDFRTLLLTKIPHPITEEDIFQFFYPKVRRTIRNVNMNLARYGLILVEFSSTTAAIHAMTDNEGQIHRRVIEVGLHSSDGGRSCDVLANSAG